jgi:sugar/nucleoside kinase (ribokinase family)
MTNKKAIAAGHICLDITPVFRGGSGSLSELLSPGTLVSVEQANVHTGGSVANTGLALKMLGVDVRLAGKVGADSFGETIRGILEKHGAADGLLVDSSGSTSYTVVLAPPGVDRVFLHHSGLNDTFGSADVTDAMLRGADLLHFGYPTQMRRMYENSGAELVDLMKRAKAAGCQTSLDMSAVDPDTDAGRVDWRGILRDVLPYVDFFLPSVEELAFMLDAGLYNAWVARAGGGEATSVIDVDNEVRPLAERCASFGAGFVLVKCGARGVYWMDADKSGFEASYKPDRILSSTGAGDTCIAAFLAAMLDGEPYEECVRLAAAQGACCVGSYDALGGLLPLSGLKEKIAAGWEKMG